MKALNAGVIDTTHDGSDNYGYTLLISLYNQNNLYETHFNDLLEFSNRCLLNVKLQEKRMYGSDLN